MKFGMIEVDDGYASFIPDLIESTAEVVGIRKEDVIVRAVPCSLCGGLMLASFVGEDKMGDVPVPEGKWKRLDEQD